MTWKTVWIKFPRVTWREIACCIVAMILGGIVALFLCGVLLCEAHGAEFLLTWTPTVTDTDGAPIEGVYYEIYEADSLRAVTFDSFLVITVYKPGRIVFRMRACLDGRPCSEYSSAVSARVISFMPDYATEGRVSYLGDEGVDLLLVMHPHPGDSLFIAYEGGVEFIRWRTYYDFTGDGWLSISDLGIFGLRFIMARITTDWNMINMEGGELDMADLVLFGELYHGSAVREWSDR